MRTKANISIPIEFENKVFSESFKRKQRNPETGVSKTNSYSKQVHVFLVDDDALFLKALEHTISSKQPSLQIKTFNSGEACLHEMHLKPSIVILDYYLNSSASNVLDGLDVLKKIKKISPKTKIIMLSSQDSLTIANTCIENGSFDYISKSESSFVRINNVLSNIVEDIEMNNTGFKPYLRIILILIIIILIINFLFII
jgi:CheY-like chemotaxis protein